MDWITAMPLLLGWVVGLTVSGLIVVCKLCKEDIMLERRVLMLECELNCTKREVAYLTKLSEGWIK